MNSQIEARLACLSEHDPISAGQLRPFLPLVETADVDEVQLEQSRKKTEKWMKLQGEDSTADLVIVAGCNQTEDLIALMDMLPDTTKLYLLLHDLHAAARLFVALPLEEYVVTGRIRLSFGADAEAARVRFLGMLIMSHAPMIWIYDGGAAQQTSIDFYTSVLLEIRESVHMNVFNLGTMIDRGSLWQHNTICNIPHLISNPGVDTLKDLFKGKPAIIVGAGPSLNDALDVLTELVDRFVIISTGTALRPLRRAGIRPDFVVSVDGSHKTAPQFEVDCDDLYLVCSSLVYPPVIPKFKGVFSCTLISNPIAGWISTFGTPKGELIAAGTVTASAVDLAVKMGCAPIITVGFDLCFNDDGTTHASNTMYHGSRVNPVKLVKVPGNLHEEVLTSEQFSCYIQLMQEYIKRNPEGHFINATTGGARIDGMDVISQGQLAAYAADRFDAYQVIQDTFRAYDEDYRQELCSELEQIRDHLSEVSGEALSAAMMCNQLILMLRMPQTADPDHAQEILEQLDEQDKFLTSARERSLFLDLSLLPIGFKMNAKRDEAEERYTDAILVNRRSRELYEQIAGASKWTRDLLIDVIKCLNETCVPDDRYEESQKNNKSIDNECLVLEEVR